MGKELNISSDNELIQEVRSGNRRAYSELVKRHQKALLRMALRFVRDLDVAEDVVQESFIKAYEKLNHFEGRSSFKSWLFQIAVNTAKNKLRENKRGTTDIDDVNIAVGAVAESSLVQTALANELQDEVDKLPVRQKTALVLRVYEDLSFKEIADIMECPYDTAKANYRHALLKLKESLDQREDLKNWSDCFNGYMTDLVQFAEVD
ncbi:MAG: sigma-70 family RNA polymerase sigma factor [Bdellovibrionaceae bacterium]|nr:sigma-70 family RNA polymerase sigma factor [Pseudobdellovibrionaceae bacterium]NUM57478.1 sigma-70 family RNA polymerase sigma factor [Pseudobdellovibrionaceae bacterium]